MLGRPPGPGGLIGFCDGLGRLVMVVIDSVMALGGAVAGLFVSGGRLTVRFGSGSLRDP